MEDNKEIRSDEIKSDNVEKESSMSTEQINQMLSQFHEILKTNTKTLQNDLKNDLKLCLDNKIEALGQNVNDKIEALGQNVNSKIDGLGNEVTVLKTCFEELHVDVNNTVKTLRQEINEMKSSWESSNEILEQKVDNLHEEMKDLSISQDKLFRKVDEEQSKIKRVQDDCKIVRQSVTDMKNDVSRLEKDIKQEEERNVQDMTKMKQYVEEKVYAQNLRCYQTRVDVANLLQQSTNVISHLKKDVEGRCMQNESEIKELKTKFDWLNTVNQKIFVSESEMIAKSTPFSSSLKPKPSDQEQNLYSLQEVFSDENCTSDEESDISVRQKYKSNGKQKHVLSVEKPNKMPKMSELKHFTTYSGIYDSLSPVSFLANFEEEAEFTGLSHKWYVKVMSFILKQSAKAWYIANKRKFVSYIRFKQEFLKHFQNETIVANRIANIRTQYFNPKEHKSVVEFVLDKYNKIKQLEHGITDTRIVCDIRNSLPMRYRNALMALNFSTFEEFLDAVQQIENTSLHGGKEIYSYNPNRNGNDSGQRNINIRNFRAENRKYNYPNQNGRRWKFYPRGYNSRNGRNDVNAEQGNNERRISTDEAREDPAIRYRQTNNRSRSPRSRTPQREERQQGTQNGNGHSRNYQHYRGNQGGEQPRNRSSTSEN